MQHLPIFPALLSLFGTCLWSSCDAMDGLDLVFETGDDPRRTPRAALQYPDIEVVADAIFKKFTMCFWLNIDGERALTTVSLVSYFSAEIGYDKEISLELNLGSEKPYTVLTVMDAEAMIPVVPPVDKWTHVCVSWDYGSGIVALYFDGVQKGTGEAYGPFTIGGDGFWVLGQTQHYYKDSYIGQYYDVETGMNGRMTQFQVFGKILTPDEVKKVKNCQLKGDVINWSTSLWSLDYNMMVGDSEAPGCAGNPCQTNNVPITKAPEPEAQCYEHPVSSEYDVTSPLGPSDKGNVVRAVLIDPPVSEDLKDFTVSFWMFNSLEPTYNIAPLAYIGSDDGAQIIVFNIWKKKISITVGGKTKQIPNIFSTTLKSQWVHVAVTWSGTKNGEIIIYINGKPHGSPLNVNPGYVAPADQELYVQQVETKPVNAANATEGFKLKMTDVNIWNKPLTPAEVSTISKCSYTLPGSVVAWEDSTYDFAL